MRAAFGLSWAQGPHSTSESLEDFLQTGAERVQVCAPQASLVHHLRRLLRCQLLRHQPHSL